MGITYNLYPHTLGNSVHPKSLTIWPLDNFWTNNHLKFLLDAFLENATQWGGGCPQSLWLLKKEGEHLISNTLCPLWSLYNHHFHKKPSIPSEHNLQPLHWGLSFSKTYFPDLSTMLNKMAISKFWLDVFWELMDVCGVFCLPIAFDY